MNGIRGGSGRNCRTPLFRVGLLRRMGIGKSRNGHACVIDAHDTRIGIEREVEGHGRCHLGDEADVRDGGTRAIAEPAARRMFGKRRLNRLQAGAKPMLDPGQPLVIADFKTSVR
jgi:hypothetical protein